MIRLTFTDEKKQVKVLGESNDAAELFMCMYNHAKRLFIHPTCSLPGNLSDPQSKYIVGQTKTGCTYEMENIGDAPAKSSGICQVCNTL